MKSTKSAWSTHLGFISPKRSKSLETSSKKLQPLLKRCVEYEVAGQLVNMIGGGKPTLIDYDIFLAKFCDKDKYRTGVIEAIKIVHEAMQLGN